MQIKAASDMRNKFSKIETLVNAGKLVYLAKNGHSGAMVSMNLKQYEQFTDDIEMKLDEADRVAATTDVRYTHDEVFGRLK
jgi:PHD/YefM family antitoxin component YafN of YafNO toxin-antitoxin module